MNTAKKVGMAAWYFIFATVGLYTFVENYKSLADLVYKKRE